MGAIIAEQLAYAPGMSFGSIHEVLHARDAVRATIGHLADRQVVGAMVPAAIFAAA